jgi:hypothetical protein
LRDERLLILVSLGKNYKSRRKTRKSVLRTNVVKFILPNRGEFRRSPSGFPGGRLSTSSPRRGDKQHSTPAMMAANMGGSRMSSCLKLHWPRTFSLFAPADAGGCDTTDPGDEPVILSFPRRAPQSGRSSQRDLLERARIIHQNRCCPICNRAAVVPVDAQPMLMSRDRMPIPGASRLVGFACDCCGHHWNA